MTILKWNYKTRKYDPHEVPDEWKIRTYCADMGEIVNCARCGKEIEFGDGYTSATLHTEYGMGYCICGSCDVAELHEERKQRGDKTNAETDQ